ncbi:hypothetical protein CSKR_113761 [Clonorchis sinensis]|uniref:Uncharacterized protein n=1 Tax=Clonorchis sinensis TaxID=79923 RepID=A0A419PFM2_CLOSI|nr:hypothetical protein CSKR_113761 [Clonorchis sinensis]
MCLRLQELNQTVLRETDSTNSREIDKPPFLAMSPTKQRGSRELHPGRRIAPTTLSVFVSAFTSFYQVISCPPSCLRHSEAGSEGEQHPSQREGHDTEPTFSKPQSHRGTESTTLHTGFNLFGVSF